MNVTVTGKKIVHLGRIVEHGPHTGRLVAACFIDNRLTYVPTDAPVTCKRCGA